jgi:pimeloyl-ACP methyl ester carboxylesterase
MKTNTLIYLIGLVLMLILSSSNLLGADSLLATNVTPVVARQAGATNHPVMVLVHGAWGGGWQFKKVGTILEAHGYQVYRPSLSGLGEHYNTTSTNIGLTTHIDDIVNFILFEDLHDVILLGHSYGGLVVAGVVDRIPDRIRRVIYLDAFLPVDGESLMTVRRPDSPDMTKNIKDGFILSGLVKPAEPPPRFVLQPLKTFTEPISLKNPAAAKVPGAFILTVPKGQRPENDTFYDSSERARARGWPVHIMEATHFPMLLQPEATAELIMNSH